MKDLKTYHLGFAGFRRAAHGDIGNGQILQTDTGPVEQGDFIFRGSARMITVDHRADRCNSRFRQKTRQDCMLRLTNRARLSDVPLSAPKPYRT